MLNVHMLVDGLIVGWKVESEKIMRNQAQSVNGETCLSHPLTIGVYSVACYLVPTSKVVLHDMTYIKYSVFCIFQTSQSTS